MTAMPNFSQIEVDHLLSEISELGHIRIQALDSRRYHVFVPGQSKPVFRVVEAFEVFDYSLRGVKDQSPSTYINLLGRGKVIQVDPATELKVYGAPAELSAQNDPSHPTTNRRNHPAREDGTRIRAPFSPPQSPPAPSVAAPVAAPVADPVANPLHPAHNAGAPVAPVSPAGAAQDGGEPAG